ncbi:hypothetical protein JW916_01315 [Candidatus Sumerlaeota bacterium]|nr:hypothetical protein [Candidatus Sumerlaeota bacterium]
MTLTVSDIQVRAAEGESLELSARVSAPGARRESFRPWFRYTGVETLTPWGDAFLALFLIPCMYSRENLHIDAPVSKRLLAAVPRIQQTIRNWYKGFSEIEVSAAEAHEREFAIDPPGTACFFSGGVDSWYTLLKHRQTVTHLLLIRGFDITREESDLWETTRGILDKAADALGMRAVTVTTNAKKYIDLGKKACPWGRRYPGRFWRVAHGSGFASTALGLQGTIERLHFPSSVHPSLFYPFGSHPDLDPLWSTENLDIVHAADDPNRTGKIRSQLADSPVALENLRVCLENRPGKLNCCRCEKCGRTMVSLRLAGVLDKAPTFPEPLDLRRLRRLYVPPDIHYAFYVEMLREAREAGDEELADAIESALGYRFTLDHALGLARQTIGSAMLSILPARLAPFVKRFAGPISRDVIAESTHLVKKRQ